jgi:LPXTG-site transpeptidase (sortase) family protein
VIAHPHPPREVPFDLELRIIRTALAALLLLSAFAGSRTAASASANGFYVASTGHALADPFLTFWVDNAGQISLGMPISDLVERNGRIAQYFQYGVLVQKTNGAVTRLRAGVELLDDLRGEPAIVDGRRAPSSRTVQGLPAPDLVRQTNVDGTQNPPTIDQDVLPYWQQWGGIELLGDPISPAYRHGAVRTQWFEFGRIDLDSSGATLAEIGLELARQSDVPTGPVDRGQLPLFDPSRFVTFSGDGTVPNASGPFDPVRLEIPKIQVDAQIEVTSVQDGVMTNPSDPWKAGWYSAFSRPGDWTNTVIAGHRDWWGYGPVVFWNLGLLQPGDKIFLLAADGTGATYIVNSTTLVPRTVDPQTIINDVGYEALTLITCGGSWTGTEYTDRIIVRAYRI